IADRGRAAAAVARRRLVITDAVLTRAVEIGVARKAEPDRGIDKRFADRVMLRHVGHAERPAGAVEFVAAARLMLGALEIGQHARRRIFAEPRCDGAAGRAGADHDEIGFDRMVWCGHFGASPIGAEVMACLSARRTRTALLLLSLLRDLVLETQPQKRGDRRL